MATEKDTRISEVEYCISSYFNSHFSPLMNSVKNRLQQDQAKEIADYQMSFGGIMSSLASASNPAGSLVDNVNEATQLKVTDATCKAYNSMVAKAAKSAITGMEASLMEAADGYRKEVRTITDGQIKRLKENSRCVTTPPATFWCLVTLFAALLSSFVIILFLNIFSWHIAPIYKAQLWPMGIALLIVGAIQAVAYALRKH